MARPADKAILDGDESKDAAAFANGVALAESATDQIKRRAAGAPPAAIG